MCRRVKKAGNRRAIQFAAIAREKIKRIFTARIAALRRYAIRKRRFRRTRTVKNGEARKRGAGIKPVRGDRLNSGGADAFRFGGSAV
ncbi:MAG: hypothetical protein LBP79_03820 [Clostridiales bacterium]|jgi:hypothetical protein|nr:hypothetical protein [Clostridiales bacterium]